mmetsp:Transcript_19705/g.43061  ORF Transcript_19705/g.43061 Transcript_19705/m.43061 type:complete len:200 (-) Transcript_19705:146-745(-)
MSRCHLRQHRASRGVFRTSISSHTNNSSSSNSDGIEGSSDFRIGRSGVTKCSDSHRCVSSEACWPLVDVPSHVRFGHSAPFTPTPLTLSSTERTPPGGSLLLRRPSVPILFVRGARIMFSTALSTRPSSHNSTAFVGECLLFFLSMRASRLALLILGTFPSHWDGQTLGTRNPAQQLSPKVGITAESHAKLDTTFQQFL